jgi:hypothetical protein
MLEFHSRLNYRTVAKAHHRLVKTTPNPRATKNNKGEFDPVPLSLFLGGLLSDGPGVAVAVAEPSVRLLIADGIVLGTGVGKSPDMADVMDAEAACRIWNSTALATT